MKVPLELSTKVYLKVKLSMSRVKIKFNSSTAPMVDWISIKKAK